MSYDKIIGLLEGDTGLDNYSVCLVINKLKSMGAVNETSVRNALIRESFDEAIKGNDYELIKHIFIDLSIEYDVSIRTVQRVVYDHMKK
tara:strand:+ start:4253 stop:4519 length:267 start_codon:yes stop_codon:yes gene_type:complete